VALLVCHTFFSDHLNNVHAGNIYRGVNIISGKEVAIKLESAEARHSQLDSESRVYKTLAGGVGVPLVCWSGTECGYNMMVLDLLGPSLEELFNYCNRSFSRKTVLLLADQLVATQAEKKKATPGAGIRSRTTLGRSAH